MTTKHTCHAHGCKTVVPPRMLMCRKHWFMVPKYIRDQVWASYREGQCDDMKVSPEWAIAANEAICAVAVQEGGMTQEQANESNTKTRRRWEEAKERRGRRQGAPADETLPEMPDVQGDGKDRGERDG